MNKQILLLVLMLSVTTSTFAIEAEIGGLWYELVPSYKEAKVIQYKNDIKYTGDIVIPETVEYDGTTYSVTSIENKAFYNCIFLYSVIIGNNVTLIWPDAFSGCYNMKSVVIGNSVTTIGAAAFQGCRALHSITIPNSVTVLSYYAFDGCDGLNSVIIGNSVTTIGNYAFQDCRELSSITIPNSVTSIGNSAFRGCFNLALISLSNSLTSIGDYAFWDCWALTSIAIPNNVASIGQNAFYGCKSLNSVYITDLETWCKIKFMDSDSNPLCHAHHLFLNGKEIKDLVIPYGVTSIGDFSFFDCWGLTSVMIPTSVTSIGYSAFDGCSGLTTIMIPSNVKSIGCYAFFNCCDLTTITIGSGIKTIKERAFGQCFELTDVYCHAVNVPNMIDYNDKPSIDAFKDSNYKNATLHVPMSSIDAYKLTVPWNDFKTIEGLNETIPKCATPTIEYSNGLLMINCETVGAKCITTISDTNIKNYNRDLISLKPIYTINVYATKYGFDDSDVATATIQWRDGHPLFTGFDSVTVDDQAAGDVNGDGRVDVSDYIGVANIILTGSVAGK